MIFSCEELLTIEKINDPDEKVYRKQGEGVEHSFGIELKGRLF